MRTTHPPFSQHGAYRTMQAPAGEHALWAAGLSGGQSRNQHAPHPGVTVRGGPHGSSPALGALDDRRNQGSDCWLDMVAIGLQLPISPFPGQAVQAVLRVLGEIMLPAEEADVQFVRFYALGDRTRTHFRLPPPLARAVLAARRRLAACHPAITLDVWRPRAELYWVRSYRQRQHRQQQAVEEQPGPAAGRADAAAWWRAPAAQAAARTAGGTPPSTFQRGPAAAAPPARTSAAEVPPVQRAEVQPTDADPNGATPFTGGSGSHSALLCI